MNIAVKISALLLVVRQQDIDYLPPLHRERLKQLCLYIASLCEPQEMKQPRSGVLLELRDYRRES